jgi:hypothetical protein
VKKTKAIATQKTPAPKKDNQRSSAASEAIPANPCMAESFFGVVSAP